MVLAHWDCKKIIRSNFKFLLEVIHLNTHKNTLRHRHSHFCFVFSVRGWGKDQQLLRELRKRSVLPNSSQIFLRETNVSCPHWIFMIWRYNGCYCYKYNLWRNNLCYVGMFVQKGYLSLNKIWNKLMHAG